MISVVAVKTAYANIYSEPTFSSQMVTQALFFEELEVLSEHGNWYEVSQWDGYRGYVHKFYLSENYIIDQSDNIVISSRFESLYNSLDFNQTPSIVIPFGTIIPTKDYDGIVKSATIDKRDYYFKHSANNIIECKRDQIILNAEKLLGSPYLWGGKTPFGYDCSGFVQSLLNSVGIKIKRDTSQQIVDSRMMKIDFKDIEKGDLVFFNIEGDNVDHVGIWYGHDDKIIHCGGEVKIQSIDDDSSIKLSDYMMTVKSLSEVLNGS